MPGLVPIVIGGGVAYLAYKVIADKEGTKTSSATGASSVQDPNQKLDGSPVGSGTGNVHPGDAPMQAAPLPDAGAGSTGAKTPTPGDPAPQETVVPSTPSSPTAPRESRPATISLFGNTITLADAPGSEGGITAPPTKNPYERGSNFGGTTGLSTSPVVEETRLRTFGDAFRSAASGLRY